MNKLHLRITCALIALAPFSTAGEYWIDPVNGSDTSSGDSPLHAWQSLTHALASIGPATPWGESETLYLLPGTYDEVSGESFPIPLRGALSVIGVGKASSIIVSGTPLEDIFTLGSDAGVIAPAAVSGITVTGGESAFHASPGIERVHLSLENLIIRQNASGVTSESGAEGGILRLDMRSCKVRGNWSGIGPVGSALLRVEDCTFRNNSLGLHVPDDADASSWVMDAEIRRTRFLGNSWGVRAISVHESSVSRLEIEDSLLAGNGVAILASDENAARIDVELNRCTIVDSTSGLSTFQDSGTMVVSDSIFAGNTYDVFGPQSGVSLENCLVGVDPVFVDAGAGDYRLAAGSPAVDAGQAPAQTLDLEGRPRDVDGNGDLLRASDLGALELVTLSGPAAAEPGDIVELELFAEAGLSSILYFSLGGPQVVPFTDQYGDLLLDPGGLRTYAEVAHGSGTYPAHVPVIVPSTQSLVGLTFTLQALSGSSSAPAGAAYSTATTLTIQ